ncbi:MAG TPA: PQQ-binding-like beta-propeller repeat protein [Rhodanobacteraceae bacterium]|nr:PQQ-binding-like beta-propeller repeat protein [Rhodanobacteraceae bacterium]
MSHAISTRAVAASLALLLLASAPRTQAQTKDPVEGAWLGTAGTDKEKIDVGFEFHRDADGKLRVRLTEPILNTFGMDGPGEVRREGDRVIDESLYIDLTLKGDTLTGTYPGPRSPASFQRVDKLPTEAPVPDLPTGPGPRWETRLSGQAFAAPVVDGDVVYIGTTGGVLNAVDAKTGAITWTFPAGGAIFGEATVDGDAVYFACDNGFLYRLDRATGKERWHYDLGDGAVPRVLPHPSVFVWDWQSARPLVADGVVYVGAGDGGFHAVDAANGTRKWRFAAADKIRSGAAIDRDNVIFGSADHFLYVVDRKTGAERWRYDTKADVDATPVVYDGHILIGNRGYGLFSLDANTGKETWKLFFWGSWVESTPVVQDGVIYIGASDLRRVSAIDPKSGRVLWRTDVYGWTWGTPVVTTDRVYAGAAGGTPYVFRHVAGFSTLDRKTGKLLTRWPLPDSGGHQWGIAGSPAKYGDSVIVATIAGSLYAFPTE